MTLPAFAADPAKYISQSKGIVGNATYYYLENTHKKREIGVHFLVTGLANPASFKRDDTITLGPEETRSVAIDATGKGMNVKIVKAWFK